MQNNRTAAEQVAWPPPGLVEPLGWVGLPVDEPPPPNEFVDCIGRKGMVDDLYL